MIRNLIALLSLIDSDNDIIATAKGKNKLPLTMKEFKKYRSFGPMVGGIFLATLNIFQSRSSWILLLQ